MPNNLRGKEQDGHNITRSVLNTPAISHRPLYASLFASTSSTLSTESRSMTCDRSVVGTAEDRTGQLTDSRVQKFGLELSIHKSSSRLIWLPPPSLPYCVATSIEVKMATNASPDPLSDEPLDSTSSSRSIDHLVSKPESLDESAHEASFLLCISEASRSTRSNGLLPLYPREERAILHCQDSEDGRAFPASRSYPCRRCARSFRRLCDLKYV